MPTDRANRGLPDGYGRSRFWRRRGFLVGAYSASGADEDQRA